MFGSLATVAFSPYYPNHFVEPCETVTYQSGLRIKQGIIVLETITVESYNEEGDYFTHQELDTISLPRACALIRQYWTDDKRLPYFGSICELEPR